jgi:hypothetical protein
MPWTSKDAEKHTHKANTSDLQELWARIANERLDKTNDEGRAIREANAVVAQQAEKHWPSDCREVHAASQEIGRFPMPDDLAKVGQPDRSKIAMDEEHEVRYWTKHLGVSKEELQRALDRVGNSAAAVKKQLGK